MIRVAHVSDLHFGALAPELVDPLLADLISARPRVVVVSGDLTQRAQRKQFRQVAEFLARVPFPQIVVPGNHDVPDWNLFLRFFRTLHHYRRYVGEDIEPVYRDKELMVVGVNTARALTLWHGRISPRQIDRTEAILSEAPDDILKVVVMHHPFISPSSGRGVRVVGRARRMLAALERAGTDLVLAGHAHRGYTRATPAHFGARDHAVLVVQAGTTLSHRTRGEANGYNLLDLAAESIVVRPQTWDASLGRFRAEPVLRFGPRGRWDRLGEA